MLRTTTLAALMIAGSGLTLAPLPALAAPPASFASNHEAAPRVRDFDVRTVRRVQPGAALRFTLEGTPGARATVSIDGTTRAVVLAETGPGIYQGTHVVSVHDRITPDSRVTARLARGDLVTTATLAEPLQRDWSAAAAPGQPEIAQIRVTEDTRGERSWLRFTVFGTPDGQATVQLAGGAGAQPSTLVLDEVRPGEYTTTLRLRPGVAIDLDQPLVARIRQGEHVATSTLDRAFDHLSASARAAAWCSDCGTVEVVRRVDRGWNGIDYEVVVRTHHGRQVVTYDRLPPVVVGDAVRVIGNTLERRTG